MGHACSVIFLFHSGKSTLLTSIGHREIPIPEHCDIFHLRREMPATEKTALECVMDVDAERIKLEKEAEQLSLLNTDGKNNAFLISSK